MRASECSDGWAEQSRLKMFEAWLAVVCICNDGFLPGSQTDATYNLLWYVLSCEVDPPFKIATTLEGAVFHVSMMLMCI